MPTGTPVDYSLARGGYIPPSNGNFGTLDPNKAGQHFGTAKADPVRPTAVKTHPTTFAGTYGEKATGTVKTQTNLPKPTALSQGFGTLAVGAMATQHHQSLQNQGVAEQISRGFSDGDWGAVAAGIGKAFDWTGIGSIYAQALYGNPDIRQQVIDPMQQQAVENARRLFEEYQRTREKIDPAQHQQYVAVTVREWGSGYKDYVRTVVVPRSEFNRGGTFLQNMQKEIEWPVKIGSVEIYPTIPPVDTMGYGTWISFNAAPATAQDIAAHNAATAPPLQDILPTEAQWAAAMNAFLQSSAATNDAVRDLVNALWGSGHLNPANTQTAVIGGAAANTFLSAPYTPAGAQTAQQTRFVVAPNGTVATSYVQRPDLGAHTSQAPTRSPVGQVRKRPDIDIDIDGGSDDKDKETQKVEICEEDDAGKLVCLEAGSDDYEDLELPKNEISLEFERKEYFDDGGSCPPNPQFQFLGKSYELSYKPICTIADTVSPMIELAGIVIAAGIAYAAVREL